MTDKTQRTTALTNPTGTAIGYEAPGASGPGHYQGMVGRKTGRPSPRPGGVQAPRHETILAAHGLMDQGAADPNQGQLWAPHELPPTVGAAGVAAQHGVAPPLASSRPGFMPGLYERQAKVDGDAHIVHATTIEAHKAMAGAIRRLPQFEVDEAGKRRGGDARETRTHTVPPGHEGPELRAPVANAMHERATTRSLHGGDAPWYASRQEVAPGRHELGPGSATEMIENSAARTGTSYGVTSRAVAITSPRTRWTEGQPGTNDFAAPNLESAENVVRGVQQAHASGERDPDWAATGALAYGRSLGEHKAKAAVDMATRTTADPIPIAELQSQKVPNFNQSLMQSHPSQAIRRQSAHSYTVDTHDVTAQGSHVDLLKTPGGYALAQMTGRRSALKHGELATMHQSGVWEGQRTKTQEPMGEHSMLETTRSGHVRPRATAMPNHVSPSQFHGDGRSDTAKRFGTEF